MDQTISNFYNDFIVPRLTKKSRLDLAQYILERDQDPPKPKGIKTFVVKKQSYDIPSRPYFLIVQDVGYGLTFNWPGIYSTRESAEAHIIKEGYQVSPC